MNSEEVKGRVGSLSYKFFVLSSLLMLNNCNYNDSDHSQNIASYGPPKSGNKTKDEEEQSYPMSEKMSVDNENVKKEEIVPSSLIALSFSSSVPKEKNEKIAKTDKGVQTEGNVEFEKEDNLGISGNEENNLDISGKKRR
jgi:hypothetical protein